MHLFRLLPLFDRFPWPVLPASLDLIAVEIIDFQRQSVLLSPLYKLRYVAAVIRYPGQSDLAQPVIGWQTTLLVTSLL